MKFIGAQTEHAVEGNIQRRLVLVAGPIMDGNKISSNLFYKKLTVPVVLYEKQTWILRTCTGIICVRNIRTNILVIKWWKFVEEDRQRNFIHYTRQ